MSIVIIKRMPFATRRLAECLSLILIGLAVSLPSHVSAAESQLKAATAPDVATIDRFVEEQMRATRIPGLALGIVQGNRVVHLRGFGAADSAGRAVTPQTPFLIASVTKPLTALAVMQLAETGAIELDAPVQRYLPWFRVADEAASARITVRQLLNHTSGLPPLTGHEHMVLETDRGPQALEQRVRALRSTSLIAPPGTTFQYSNPGYAALALIVEAVSGKSYEDYLQQHVYEPLQMRRSFTTKAAAKQAGLATGYRYWFGVPVAYDWSYSRAELGAGFTYASAEDLTHFVIAQLNGGRYADAHVLSPESTVALHQPTARLAYSRPLVEHEGYGMGWFVREAAGVQTVSHAGVAPNFYAEVMLVPDKALGVVLLANGMNNLHPAPIAAITSGVTGMLVGTELPPTVSTNDLMPSVLNLVLGVGLIQALAIGWSLWRRGAVRSRPRWAMIPPLMLNLIWAALCLVVVPRVFRWPLSYLRFEVPDLGYALVLSGTIALAWGVVRPMLMLWRRRRRPAPVAWAGAREARRIG